MTNSGIVKLQPIYKNHIWGGTKLKTVFNKNTLLDTVAESWELSANRDGESMISGGEYNGLKLSEYITTVGKEVVGTKAHDMDYFPISYKADRC